MCCFSFANRLCFAVGLFVASTVACEHADAQYYRFGPRGGVSIRSPFFSLNVPSAPYHYGPGNFGFHPPIPPFQPFPDYRYYEYWYPSPAYGLGYLYGPSGYFHTPMLSHDVFALGPTYFSPDGHALRYDSSTVDPYSYRGDVIRSNEAPEAYSVGRVPIDSNRLADELRVAAEQLRQSLASRPGDGDVWLEYLHPDAVIDALDVTKRAEPGTQKLLNELTRHYDGVAENPALRYVSITSGFDRTRQLLRIWVERFSEVDAVESPSGSKLEPAVNDRPTEVLPMPDPAADASVAPEPKSRRSL